MNVKLLDWYILKRFLVTFFFTVLLLISVICVIDLTERLDDFLFSGASFMEVFVDYYLNFIPWIANMLTPILIFISSVFITARMAAQTEFVAMLSSGMSYLRILVPYVIGATMIAILTFYLIGWVIPKANQGRVDFENKYFEDDYTFDGHNVHIKITPDTYVYLENYNSELNIAYQFTMEKIVNNRLRYKFKTDKLTWKSADSVWHADVFSERFFEGGKEKYVSGVNRDLRISLAPSDFGNTYMLQTTFTLPELERYIDELNLRGAENVSVYLVEKYERYTYPFAVIILTVIGVVVSSKKSREGTGFKIAFGFVLAFIYILMVIVSRNFANVGDIHPLLAAWIPNIIFSIIGFVLYRQVPK